MESKWISLLIENPRWLVIFPDNFENIALYHLPASSVAIDKSKDSPTLGFVVNCSFLKTFGIFFIPSVLICQKEVPLVLF